MHWIGIRSRAGAPRRLDVENNEGPITFEGRRCTIAFEDPLAAERTKLNGRTFPLAADFTVPLAVMLAETDTSKLELACLLRPEKYAEKATICASTASPTASIHSRRITAS